jgi:hypothetical protein
MLSVSDRFYTGSRAPALVETRSWPWPPRRSRSHRPPGSALARTRAVEDSAADQAAASLFLHLRDLSSLTDARDRAPVSAGRTAAECRHGGDAPGCSMQPREVRPLGRRRVARPARGREGPLRIAESHDDRTTTPELPESANASAARTGEQSRGPDHADVLAPDLKRFKSGPVDRSKRRSS